MKKRIILGLDISTACIGACIIIDNGDGEIPEIQLITHKAPKISKKITGIESLFLKKRLFETEFISTLKDIGITDVVIEEPLLASNNVNTVATLLRFNGMISDAIYENLGIVPKFISSYDARMFSFPELVSIRKYNMKGNENDIKKIKKSLKDEKIVLFGNYPFDIDKKQVMMDMVNTIYPEIEWIYDKKGRLKKENFDMCDSLVCALAYVNINRNGLEIPKLIDYEINNSENGYEINYKVKIWNKIFDKKLSISL